MKRKNEFISIHVADDGIEFNTSKMSFYSDYNKGFGLFSIKDRLNHLGGKVEIRSRKGRGTRSAYWRL